MSHQLLQQENLALKKQVNVLQQQLNYNKNQLDQQNEELFAKQRILRTSRKMSCMRKEIITEKSKQMKKAVDLENVMSRLDARNAVMASFGDTKAIILAPTMDPGHNKSGSDPLAMRLSAAKKQKHSAIFKKYEMMLKIGVDLGGVLEQMKKDKIGNSLINEFEMLYDDNINDNDWKIDITSAKYSKYNRMKKLRMPLKTILNKMRLDGISQLEMDIFCGKAFGSTYNVNKDPLKIAEQLGLPQKLDIPKPKERMKKIHWKPVNLQKVKHSIWNKVNHQWFDYEPKKFELRFQARKNKPKLSEEVLRKAGVSDNIQNENQKVQFVDSSRSQEVESVLRSFNMTNDELRNVILTMDDTKMSMDKISSLISIAPTPSEQSCVEINSLDKNIKYFGISERFFYSLYDILELQQRLKKWLFKIQFEDKVNELTEQITIIEKAKLAITLSRELREIFAILLAFGNHMNYGNKRSGNAYGFLLSDLSLLQQIKTFDNTMTFPTYLYSFLQKKYPDLLDIIDQFKVVHEAAKICGDTIDKQYNMLIRETKDLDAMITRFEEEYCQLLGDNDMFIAKMRDFQETIKQLMWKLRFKFESFHKCESQLIKYFAYETDEEITERIKIQEIFMDISVFIQMLEDGQIELKEFEAMKKKRAIKRERLIRKKKKAAQKRANTEHLTRNRMKKYVAPKKKQYALSLEDIGTSVGDKQASYDSIMYLFDENVENQAPPKQVPKLLASTSTHYNGPSPLPQKKNIISFGRFSGKNLKSNLNSAIIHPYDSCFSADDIADDITDDEKEDDLNISKLKLKLDTKYNTMRRNSDPSTPVLTPNKHHNDNINNSLASRIKMFESKISKSNNNNNNNKNNGRVHKKKNSVCLISSNSRLTPCGDTSHANVEERFGAIETSINNNNNHKSRHKRRENMNRSLPLKSKELNNYSTNYQTNDHKAPLKLKNSQSVHNHKKRRKKTRTFSNQFVQSIFQTNLHK